MMVKNNLRVEGRSEIVKNLNVAIKSIQNNTRKGMQEASKFIKTGSQAKTPVDTDDLRKSAFYRTGIIGQSVVAVIGYMARYAPWVHEKPGTLKGLPRTSGNGNYWDPDGEPKFLQNFVVANVRKILEILAKFASRTPK